MPTTTASVPTGTVSLSVDGGTATSLPLTAGVATYSFSSTTAGAHVLTATYSGDTTFAASSGTLTLNVGGTTTSGASFTLAVTAPATVAPGGSATRLDQGRKGSDEVFD